MAAKGQSRRTPGSGIPTASGARMRSPSPTRISRAMEKDSLVELNNRLANYIDKVRSLETENKSLNIQIKTYEETTTREVTNIKNLYERELSDARKALDDLAKDKARIQIDATKHKNDLDDIQTKFTKRDRDAALYEKKYLSLESEVHELKSKVNDATGKVEEVEAQRRYWEQLYKDLKAAYDALQKKLAAVQKELENETLLRVELENRAQSLKEELNFNSQIHEQQLNETRSRQEVTIDEMDTTLQRAYENKVGKLLRDMREEQEREASSCRAEMEAMFERKLSDFRNAADKKSNAALAAQEEVKNLRRKHDEVSQIVTKLRSDNALFEKRIKELQDQLVHEQDDHAKSIEMYKTEIQELRNSIEDQMIEYNDLMDIKIALDMEIAAYRKLLEGEEERLNISSSSETSFGREPPSRTPTRATPTRGTKRKRVTLLEGAEGLGAYTQARSSSDFQQSHLAKGPIEIAETNTEGKFIKLHNTSTKDVSLSGWQLKHTGGDQETVYKFHRTITLKPDQYCTIWSADQSDVTHNPPTDLVMKQRWFTSDNMKTFLLNKEAEEVAHRELKRTLLRVSQTSYRSRDVAGTGQVGDRSSCVLM